MQARRCLDEGTDEAWQIDNESQPVNPRWRRNAAQTPFLRPPNPDSSIVAPLRVFDGAHPILTLRAILAGSWQSEPCGAARGKASTAKIETNLGVPKHCDINMVAAGRGPPTHRGKLIAEFEFLAV
jgi:hypothetical protein